MSKIGKIFKSFINGEFLLTIGLDKYIIHVIYTFLLFMLAIWIGIRVEKTFIRVQNNKKELNDLKIKNYELNFLIEELNGTALIEQKLEEAGSTLHRPTQPAHKTK
ncbi:MAG: hypothetical protein LIQ26_04710 [Bacteroidota bacterium]|nr:hypothetical protein [Bacteroidota bacterium]